MHALGVIFVYKILYFLSMHMHKTIIRVTPLLAVCWLILTLVGCGTKWVPTDTTETPSDTAQQEAQKADAPAAAWTGNKTGSGSAANDAATIAAAIAAASAETKPSEYYQVYSAAKLDAALKEKKQVALFFYSAWSDISKRLDKDLANNASLVWKWRIVFRVDFDKENDLKKKYDIKSDHTTVYLKSDKTALKTDVNSVGVAQVIGGFTANK